MHILPTQGDIITQIDTSREVNRPLKVNTIIQLTLSHDLTRIQQIALRYSISTVFTVAFTQLHCPRVAGASTRYQRNGSGGQISFCTTREMPGKV